MWASASQMQTAGSSRMRLGSRPQAAAPAPSRSGRIPTSVRRPLLLACSTDPEASPSGTFAPEAGPQQQQPDDAAAPRPKQPKRKAESTDAIASFLTRRFGIAGGLAWLGFLAVGTLGEQVKTRIEVAAEKEGTREIVGGQVRARALQGAGPLGG
jgi:hypothetical protein